MSGGILKPETSVFLTGASGFIGQRLLARLRESGAALTALALPDEARALPADVRVCVGDVTDPAALTRILREVRPALILHLAAVGVADPGLPGAEALRVNTFGALNLLEAAREVGGVRRIVMAGSSYEYGGRRSDDGLDPLNAYSASKVAAWAFARSAYNTWGAPVVWTRLFQVYGPGQRAGAFVPAAIHAALAGADFPMTAGEQWRDFVYVDDAVAGLLAVAVAPAIEGRALDIGGGVLYRLRDVVERIWALAARGGHIQAGALPYRPGEAPAIAADVDRTRLLTGWQARVSLDEGLQRTCAVLAAEFDCAVSDVAVTVGTENGVRAVASCTGR